MMKTSFLCISFALAACILPVLQGSAKVTNQLRDELPAPYEYYYGIYLNGIKVGWMKSGFTVDQEQASFSVNLHASVEGMGKTSQIQLNERRSYNLKDGNLEQKN